MLCFEQSSPSGQIRFKFLIGWIGWALEHMAEINQLNHLRVCSLYVIDNWLIDWLLILPLAGRRSVGRGRQCEETWGPDRKCCERVKLWHSSFSFSFDLLYFRDTSSGSCARVPEIAQMLTARLWAQQAKQLWCCFMIAYHSKSVVFAVKMFNWTVWSVVKLSSK